jgi:hypothetical protein
MGLRKSNLAVCRPEPGLSLYDPIAVIWVLAISDPCLTSAIIAGYVSAFQAAGLSNEIVSVCTTGNFTSLLKT